MERLGELDAEVSAMDDSISVMATVYGEPRDDKSVETVMQAVASFGKLLQEVNAGRR